MATRTTKKALEAEADGDLSFDFEGVTYTVPTGNRWPLDAVEAMEENRVAGFVKALIGEDKYKLLRRKTKTVGDLDRFVDALFAAANLDPKE